MVLEITKTAKDNVFVNCEINGKTRIEGKGTKMISTRINEIKKDHPFVFWIGFAASLIAVGGFLLSFIEWLVKIL